MRYVITGASKETGKEYSESIHAASAAEAEIHAAKRGMLVSDVTAAQPPEEIEYRYWSMRLVSWALVISGILMIPAGLCVALFGIVKDTPDLTITMIGAAICMCGLLWAAAGQSVGAVRDIAINSFR